MADTTDSEQDQAQAALATQDQAAAADERATTTAVLTERVEDIEQVEETGHFQQCIGRFCRRTSGPNININETKNIKGILVLKTPGEFLLL